MSTWNRTALVLTQALALGSFSACAIRRPCAEGGDLSGLTPLPGDALCFQRELRNGKSLNHGRFEAYHPNGKTAIEGQFLEGRRVGVWTFYTAEGKKSAERTYNADGVEVSGPTPAVPGNLEDQAKPGNSTPPSGTGK